MVIHTGGNKRKGARADLATGDRASSATQLDSKDVPQFAPNFTVYVLPPDVVCLYSEDRKFFLHGELSCALATAIGAGRSYRDIFRGLTQTFPPDTIDEALRAHDRSPLYRHRRARHRRDHRRLLDEPRPAVRGRGAEISRNAPFTSSRSTSKGRRHFRRRLGALGVRVARRSGDLTVVLASDYLEERLDAVNRRHLSDRHAVAARPAFRHLSVGGAGLQAGRGRLLGLPCRADAAQPRDQGVPRPRRCPLRLGLAAGARRGGPGRGPACGRRDRQGDRHRLSHRSARSRRQPRPHGLERRAALRPDTPAVSGVRARGAARSKPRAGADRASLRQPSS